MFDYLTEQTVIVHDGTSDGFVKPTSWLRIGEIRYVFEELADVDRLIEAAKETRGALASVLGLVVCDSCSQHVERTSLVTAGPNTGDLCDSCKALSEERAA